MDRARGPAPAPIIVKIVETPHDPTGLAEVLIGSIGLTGVILLLALVRERVGLAAIAVRLKFHHRGRRGRGGKILSVSFCDEAWMSEARPPVHGVQD